MSAGRCFSSRLAQWFVSRPGEWFVSRLSTGLLRPKGAKRNKEKKKEEGIFFIYLTKAVGRNAERLSSTNLVLRRIFRTEGKFYNLNQNLQSSSLRPKTSQICLAPSLRKNFQTLGTRSQG